MRTLLERMNDHDDKVGEKLLRSGKARRVVVTWYWFNFGLGFEIGPLHRYGPYIASLLLGPLSISYVWGMS